MAHHMAMSSAALVAGMGGFAYLRAKSTASLLGSAAIASLFAGAAHLIAKTDHVGSGCALGAMGGLASATIGLVRWRKGARTVVPGTLLFLGLANAGYYGYNTYKWKDNM